MNPNEDTQWNDVLRQYKIIPDREEIKTEDERIEINKAQILDSKTIDELDELEDEEEERVLQEYKRKRLQELRDNASRARYGEVIEISAVEYIKQVNQAGEDVWVVLHLYKSGMPLCTLINDHLRQLALKYPTTKFLKSISTVCIQNYPDKNLPTIFVYNNGELKDQLIGPFAFNGMKCRFQDLEWKLYEFGALETKEKLEKPEGMIDARNNGDAANEFLKSAIRQSMRGDDDDD